MNANLFRRLMSAFYDLLFIIAILFIATALVLIINGGDAVDQGHPLYWFYVGFLCVISFTYYAWFWIKGHQTPGMKTWRLQLYRSQGIDLKFAIIYGCAALVSTLLAGAGFLLALVHPERKTLHDIIAGCEMRDLR